MSSIDGEAELLELWGRIRIADDRRQRLDLVADAICQTSRLVTMVHEARRAAVRVMAHGDKTNQETTKLIARWKGEYQ